MPFFPRRPNTLTCKYSLTIPFTQPIFSSFALLFFVINVQIKNILSTISPNIHEIHIYFRIFNPLTNFYGCFLIEPATLCASLTKYASIFPLPNLQVHCTHQIHSSSSLTSFGWFYPFTSRHANSFNHFISLVITKDSSLQTLFLYFPSIPSIICSIASDVSCNLLALLVDVCRYTLLRAFSTLGYAKNLVISCFQAFPTPPTLYLNIGTSLSEIQF